MFSHRPWLLWVCVCVWVFLSYWHSAKISRRHRLGCKLGRAALFRAVALGVLRGTMVESRRGLSSLVSFEQIQIKHTVTVTTLVAISIQKLRSTDWCTLVSTAYRVQGWDRSAVPQQLVKRWRNHTHLALTCINQSQLDITLPLQLHLYPELKFTLRDSFSSVSG